MFLNTSILLRSSTRILITKVYICRVYALQMLSLVGVQYILDEENTNEPSLFVIKKIFRSSPTKSSLLDVFYCLDGVIYKCPVLLEAARARFSKSAFHLLKSFHHIEKIRKQQQEKEKEDDVGDEEDGVSVDSKQKRKRAKMALPSLDSALVDLQSFL